MKCVPVKRQIIARHDFDGFRSLKVPHDIASHVDGGQVFHWAVVVSAFTGRAIVGWGSNALAGSLVDAIDVHALYDLVRNL